MNTDATIEHEESVQAEVSEVSPLVGMMRPAVPFRQKPLFEHSLLETSGEQRSRRTWATLLSLVLQCSLVAVLILVPLWFTDVLPKQQLVTFLVAPSPPPPPPPRGPGASYCESSETYERHYERTAPYTGQDPEQSPDD